ncbi:PsbQ-like domain-containing protein [Dioscorea alata]|uniref:PsbQ-like domain-containing protein n=1 Tax=Dioscorea alata TaxID=55571 RepID=A0ACB7WVA9_DIOAL|nr:PsbQ-like domain-containing protein [Dioscorea alata]
MCSNIPDHRDFSSMVKMRRLKIRRTKTRVDMKEMELENLKLYLENKCIMEENKRLRERALFLRRENRALLSHISSSSREATALHNP